MAAAGDTLSLPESAVDPNFRPDEVPVTWRSGASATPGGAAGVGAGDADPDPGPVRGAEATVTVEGDRVVKRRVPKRYRHPDLDATLRRDRTVAEARLTAEARRAGVPTPLVHDVDTAGATITFQSVGDADLAAALTPGRARTVGEYLAACHGAGVVHGDPTTRNVRVDRDAGRLFLVDFGLGYHSGHVEDHAMDLHVFRQSVAGTAADPDAVAAAVVEGYEAAGEGAVLDRLREIAGRGRYR
jgi:N6-L-threonylcarbamoyladenine synthase/protein kinase Bud32